MVRSLRGGRAHCVIGINARLGCMSLTSELLELARTAGADASGVTSAEPFETSREKIISSVASGNAGPLGFTYQDPETATDVSASLPWARSLFVIGVSYIGETVPPGDSGPLVGRFATRDFYTPVRRIARIVSNRLVEAGGRTAILIDDNRLVDRSAAVRAGIGWLGRSTMVLAPGIGPWMLLGTVVTDLELEPSSPMQRDCGTCTACIPACPTGAILDGVLDARRCLATWLQTPGSVPHWIRPRLGRRIYGCDDCLTSCPPGHPSLRRSPGKSENPSDWTFAGLLSLDDETLLDRFNWWFVPRREGRYIRRNLLIAAGNSREEDAHPTLVEHLTRPSSMIRGHAAWAVARSAHPEATSLLHHAIENERTPEGRDEMTLALIMLEQPDLHAEILALDERATTEPDLAAIGLVGDADDGWRLLEIDRSSTPAATLSEMAGAVRVNDPDRILERARRRSRVALTESG